MIKKRVRRNINSEINIVPLLDVLLVLILILVAITPIVTQSVNVDLPYTDESKIISNDSNIPLVIIEVSGVGQYDLLVNHQRLGKLSIEQITSKARSCMIANPRTIFLIGGAKDVPYNEIIKIINLFHQAGVKSIGLMTQSI